ncbi:hypothetical protein LTR08_001786 [Meristemomyces frigidus]|nr:hypothetical protein LTR08_001786 [Meristemomyces frigidus]
MPLPSALLDYLDSLDIVSSQYHGEPLTACAPLVTPGLLKRHSDESVLKRFEGPRRTVPQQALVTPAPQAVNGTLNKRQYASGSRSGFGSGVGTGTTGSPVGAKQSTSSRSQSTSSRSAMMSMSMESATFTPEPSALSSEGVSTTDAVASSAESSEVVNGSPSNVHTTAFVISAVTGRAIITTESVATPALPVLISPSPTTPPSSGGTPSTGDDGNGESGNTGTSDNSGSSAGSGSSSGSDSSGGDGSGADSFSNTGSSTGSGSSGGSDGSSSGGSGDDSGSDNTGGATGSGSSSGSDDSADGSDGLTGGSAQSGGNGNGQSTPNNDGQSGSGSGQVVSPAAGNLPTSTSPSSSPDLSNLIAQIGSVATQNGAPGSPSAPAVVASQAIVTAGGHTFTAVQSGGAVVLQDASSTAAVNGNSVATFADQTVSLLPHGSGFAVNGQTVNTFAPAPMSGAVAAGATQAVVTAGGHTFTAIQDGGSLILQDASSTSTVSSDSVAIFAGQTVSLLSSGSAFAVNGQTLSAVAPTPTLGLGAVVTGSGYTYTASPTGNSVVLDDASSTATVQNGAVTTFAGRTVSAGAGGSAIVVGGDSTVRLSTLASSSSTGLGEYIHSGLNAAATTSVRNGAATPSGSASASVSSGVDVSSGHRTEISLVACACLLAALLVI